MKLLYSLKDNQFPDNGYNHTRSIVRAIVYNDNNEIALNYVLSDDRFGHRDYFETPGGGVEKGETLIEALRRELKEEVGAEIDQIVEIGRVVDFYNLIYRRNNNHYYMCHVTSLHEKHLTDKEIELNIQLKWMSIDEAIKNYEGTKRTKISSLVIDRELPILKIAKEMMNHK